MTSAKHAGTLCAALTVGALLAGLRFLSGHYGKAEVAAEPLPKAPAPIPPRIQSAPKAVPMHVRVAPAPSPATEEAAPRAEGDEWQLKEPPTLSAEDRQTRDLEHGWISGRFKSDPVDAAWSAETRSKLVGLLQAGGFDSNAIQEVECRAAVCRIGLKAEDGGNALELVRVGRQIHEENWVDSKKDGDERWSVEFYFARPGKSLSTLISYPQGV
jgi:hypothetical protein